MKNYDDFSFLEVISIEIGSDCNLKNVHKCCPVNCIKRTGMQLSINQIVEIMDKAIQLKFKGQFAFHFYNEPLLYADKICKIKSKRPDYKFMLWTNGTLIRKLLKEGFDFNIFQSIVITRYKGFDDLAFLHLNSIHNDVNIFDEEMDDRLNFYESKTENFISCKKIYYELPIDCEGNVYICTYDWRKKYLLGNVLEQDLEMILKSSLYQKLLKGNEKRFRHCDDIVDLCKYCPRPYTTNR